MYIESFAIVFYTCIFLLPGFIIKTIIDTLVHPPKYNEAQYFLSYLLYSIVNCALYSWMYVLLLKNIEIHSVCFLILLILITIIGSVLLGMFIGIIKQKEIVDKILSKLDINKIHSIPTAWDYFFAKQEAVWIIITLKNGNIIYGDYSSDSFASSDPEERDLYIERTYNYIQEGEPWVEDTESRGILVSKDEIATIEFKIKGE